MLPSKAVLMLPLKVVLMLPSKSSTYATLKSSTLPPKQFLARPLFFLNSFFLMLALNWLSMIIIIIIYATFMICLPLFQLVIKLRVTKINVVLFYMYT